MEPLALTQLTSINQIAPDIWDRLMGRHPFTSHAFLKALEDSGSVTPKTGWAPRHLCVRDEGGDIVGVMAQYLKAHSFGEYIFDWSWAEAYEKAGGRYYPKLLSMVPFTPVTGPRLGCDGMVMARLAATLPQLVHSMGLSGMHINFISEEDEAFLTEAGFHSRFGIQYHFEDQGYGDFDGFLGALSSRKRKSIRKERAFVANLGLKIETLIGDQISSHHWDAFHRFYREVVNRKLGHAYLNRKFFDLLAASELRDRLVLIWAEDEMGPLAVAFHVLGKDYLWGRMWGAREEIPGLHFELCYYRAIELALKRGIKTIEAGAQGGHKIARGYRPSLIRSAHLFRDAGFHGAIGRVLETERHQVMEAIRQLDELSPYRSA